LEVRVVVDTSAHRKFVDGDAHVLKLVQQAQFIGMPVPVVAELRSGFAFGSKSARNESVLTRFLDSKRVELLACDAATSVYYAQLYVHLRRAGTPIPINNIWIAALTLQYQASLFTFDSDFDLLPQVPRCL
jgi:tRNA(fMet)-specific endonuclease VapC